MGVIERFRIGVADGNLPAEEATDKNFASGNTPRVPTVLVEGPMTVERVLRKHEEELLRLPNVVSVGIGEKEGKEVIVVFVRKKMNKSELRPEDVVPGTLEGFETDVREEIRVG